MKFQILTILNDQNDLDFSENRYWVGGSENLQICHFWLKNGTAEITFNWIPRIWQNRHCLLRQVLLEHYFNFNMFAQFADFVTLQFLKFFK